MSCGNAEVSASLPEKEALNQQSDRATSQCCDCRTGNAELGKWPDAEDEQRVENEVDAVCNPQQAHGYGCIARAAKHGVVERQQDDDPGKAERDSRVRCSHVHYCGRPAKQAQEFRSEQKERNPDKNGKDDSDRDSLHRIDRSTVGIVFADSARDQRGDGGA